MMQPSSPHRETGPARRPDTVWTVFSHEALGMESTLVTLCKVAGGTALGLLLYDFLFVKRVRRKLEEEFDRQRSRLPAFPATPIPSALPGAAVLTPGGPAAPATATGMSGLDAPAAAPAGVLPTATELLSAPLPLDRGTPGGDAATEGNGTVLATKRREVLFLEMQRRELEKYSRSLVDQQARLDEERLRLQGERKAFESARAALPPAAPAAGTTGATPAPLPVLPPHDDDSAPAALRPPPRTRAAGNSPDEFFSIP